LSSITSNVQPRTETWIGPDEPGSEKPSIFAAVQEQLGLKLESVREPVDVVVIDHVDRPAED
jgi:uncharacterized protein (TIGR03435 family)